MYLLFSHHPGGADVRRRRRRQRKEFSTIKKSQKTKGFKKDMATCGAFTFSF